MSNKDMFSLEGKVALVTGASGILGKKFCAALAEKGADIILVDIDEAALYEFSEELRCLYGKKTLAISCDVSNPDSVNQMMKKSLSQFDEINILHNNAASKSSSLESFFKPFEEYECDTWEQVMSVNINGMFLVAQAVGKNMVAQGKGGSIIQTSSIYGVVGPDQRIYDNAFYLGTQINTPAVYSVSKAAVIGLTQYLATYWGSKSIRVNCLTPGGVESGQNDDFKRNYAQRVPLGRMANKDELIGALIYLASDASSYVTGQNLVVDGGLTAW